MKYKIINNDFVNYYHNFKIKTKLKYKKFKII